MRMLSGVFGAAATAALMFSMVGCAEEGPLDQEEVIEGEAEVELPADSFSIPFQQFVDEKAVVPSSVASNHPGTWKVFKTKAAYRSYFKSTGDGNVNWDNEWVAFYSAGSRNSGGYAAQITKISLSESGKTLTVATRLKRPGPTCIVTLAITHPKVMVRFRRPNTVVTGAPASTLRFTKQEVSRDCQAVQQMARCQQTSDCVIVPQGGCGCGSGLRSASVNKNFTSLWSTESQCAPGTVRPQCSPPPPGWVPPVYRANCNSDSNRCEALLVE